MGHVLLIEDNQQNADMVIRLLDAVGIQVKHSLRGLEGAHMARNERPDLILMDFDLPDVDGRTMALVLKKQLGGEAAPPIVAVTARTGDNEMKIAQRFGCVAFVSKPFVPEEFVELVQKLIAKKRTTSTQTMVKTEKQD
jgi:two-component system, cell cycle response regulator DivK